MIKKYLATASSGTLYWDMITYAVNKVMNYSKDPNTGLTPAEMIFGSENTGPSFLRGEEGAVLKTGSASSSSEESGEAINISCSGVNLDTSLCRACRTTCDPRRTRSRSCTALGAFPVLVFRHYSGR